MTIYNIAEPTYQQEVDPQCFSICSKASGPKIMSKMVHKPLVPYQTCPLLDPILIYYKIKIYNQKLNNNNNTVAIDYVFLLKIR